MQRLGQRERVPEAESEDREQVIHQDSIYLLPTFFRRKFRRQLSKCKREQRRYDKLKGKISSGAEKQKKTVPSKRVYVLGNRSIEMHRHLIEKLEPELEKRRGQEVDILFQCTGSSSSTREEQAIAFKTLLRMTDKDFDIVVSSLRLERNLKGTFWDRNIALLKSLKEISSKFDVKLSFRPIDIPEDDIEFELLREYTRANEKLEERVLHPLDPYGNAEDLPEDLAEDTLGLIRSALEAQAAAMKARNKILASQIEAHCYHPKSAPTSIVLCGAVNFEIARGGFDKIFADIHSEISETVELPYGRPVVVSHWDRCARLLSLGKDISDEDLYDVFFEMLFPRIRGHYALWEESLLKKLESLRNRFHESDGESIADIGVAQRQLELFQASRFVGQLSSDEKKKLYEGCMNVVKKVFKKLGATRDSLLDISGKCIAPVLHNRNIREKFSKLLSETISKVVYSVGDGFEVNRQGEIAEGQAVHRLIDSFGRKAKEKMAEIMSAALEAGGLDLVVRPVDNNLFMALGGYRFFGLYKDEKPEQFFCFSIDSAGKLTAVTNLKMSTPEQVSYIQSIIEEQKRRGQQSASGIARVDEIKQSVLEEIAERLKAAMIALDGQPEESIAESIMPREVFDDVIYHLVDAHNKEAENISRQRRKGSQEMEEFLRSPRSRAIILTDIFRQQKKKMELKLKVLCTIADMLKVAPKI